MADPVFHLGVGVYAAEDGMLCPAELSSQDDVTQDQTTPVTSAQVQPCADFTCLCPLTDSQSVMLISQTDHDCIDSWNTQLSDWHCVSALMSDIFKHPLTHISSIPKGCVEWLLVMLEQVLDISKAFNLEDLWFLLDDLPEINRQSD